MTMRLGWLCIPCLLFIGGIHLHGQSLDMDVLDRKSAATWLATLQPDQLDLVEKLNRADRKHLRRLPWVVAPRQWPSDELEVSPFNHYHPEWRERPKGILVDLALQAFGAYEFGRLVRWGPVNSGVERTPTPPGEYHLNWRAKRHVSTENKDWILHWYFNFENKQGRALHAYEMPGMPASHSCVRLLARDAKWVYEWANSWVLAAGGREVVSNGTPLLIQGVFDFSTPPPWWPAGLAPGVH